MYETRPYTTIDEEKYNEQNDEGSYKHGSDFIAWDNSRIKNQFLS